MNISSKANVGVLTALCLSLASFACQGYGQELPLRGTVLQQESQVISFPEMSVEGSGEGRATPSRATR